MKIIISNKFFFGTALLTMKNIVTVANSGKNTEISLSYDENHHNRQIFLRICASYDEKHRNGDELHEYRRFSGKKEIIRYGVFNECFSIQS
jgi:hypothetical protein